jgi:hypothetical protein
MLSKYKFYSFWFDPTGLEPTIYRTRSEDAKRYTSDMITLTGMDLDWLSDGCFMDSDNNRKK